MKSKERFESVKLRLTHADVPMLFCACWNALQRVSGFAGTVPGGDAANPCLPCVRPEDAGMHPELNATLRTKQTHASRKRPNEARYDTSRPNRQ